MTLAPLCSHAGANAKSDFTPVDLWLEEWYAEAGQFLQDLDRPSVVKLVWALAQLGLQPSDAWLQPLIVRASDLLQVSAIAGCESTMFVACGPGFSCCISGVGACISSHNM